ncbi:MAG TPA: HDOD domain-containing protein [Tepidisphaeraceae bacterium]|nr:HDOD domain-containing protein [Tepidisphaeraceae bacterium]
MADVLVIDSSALCRELLGRVLEVHGYSAAWAGPDEAAEMLRRLKPALLILDPGLAGSEGWRLLSVLQRARERGDALQIIILAEASDKADVLRAAELGVRGYMLKRQFSLPELLVRVRRHVVPTAPPQLRGIAGAATAGSAGAAGAPAPGHAADPTNIERASANPADLRSFTHAAPTAAPSGYYAETMGNAAPVATTVPTVNPAFSRPLASIVAPAPYATAEEDRKVLMEAAQRDGLAVHTREQTLRRLEQAPVKALPGVVAELIALVSSPRGSVGDIAQILRRDPILTARVLRVANSAAFATERNRTSTVEDAVKQIGMAGVRNLVLNVGVFDAFAGSATDGLRMLRVWQHCLGVAMLMEKVAPQDISVPPGSAYLVGLCHDLPEIVLRQQFAGEYETITTLAARTGRPLRQAEAVVFGIPYGELVTHLLTRLRLPPLITLPIEEFFERGDRKSAAGAGSLLGRALRAMNVYAHGLMLAPGVSEPVTPLTQAECRNTFGAAGLTAPDDEKLRNEAMATASVLGGLTGPNAQKLFEPLAPTQPIRVGYLRHADYGTMDPLASLLRLTARELAMISPLAASSPDALGEAGALVVAGPRAGGAEAFAREMDQVRRLLAGRAIPVLYLGGNGTDAAPADLPTLCVRRLPITIEAMGAFLAASAGQGPALDRARAA